MQIEYKEEDVVHANREIYDQFDPDEYERNDAIFHPRRQEQFKSNLLSLKPEWPDTALLNIGCGTGNICRLANGIFSNRYGIDISQVQLTELKKREPEIFLCQADAGQLPFKDNSMDCCTCCSVLHHLHSHKKLFQEVYRVLRPGGYLYTDHDPNYYFYRIYRWYLLRTHSLNSTESIAEYHQFKGGLNPDKLAELLDQVGFEEIKITYRVSENPALGFLRRAILMILKTITQLLPFKTMYTHFFIIAKK